jgi:hypothetical protein
MEEDTEMTMAVLFEMPRLVEKHGMEKTHEILDCMTAIFKAMQGRSKDVCAEAFATILKIGNDANKKDQQP